MHRILIDCATQVEGEGTLVKVIVNHKVRSRHLARSGKDDIRLTRRLQCVDVDLKSGDIRFENGNTIRHDVVIGADGIGSAVRGIIGIQPERRPHESSCLHANIETKTAVKLGLVDYGKNAALEYWGGQKEWNKIVLSPCNGGSLLSYYCFFPREKGDYAAQKWDAEGTTEELVAPYPDLDEQVLNHLKIGIEVRPWRLWVHQPYAYWQKGVACVMGDAAHPVSTCNLY